MLNFHFALFSQDFQDFGSSYLCNGNRYQQTVESFLFGFQWSFILANKKSYLNQSYLNQLSYLSYVSYLNQLSKISMHRHIKRGCCKLDIVKVTHFSTLPSSCSSF